MTKATNEVLEVLSAVKSLARRYRELTGKPLGVTGEVGGYDVIALRRVSLFDCKSTAAKSFPVAG